MRKIVKYIILILVMLFLLNGCSGSYNSSPENVAEEMVKRLSKGNYDKMEQLFYHEQTNLFDSKVFKSLINYYKLNIEGNKKNNLKEVGSQITKEDGFIHCDVKIEIDEGTFNFDTIQVNDKWYVYEENFYDKDITLVVPENSKVYINDKQLDSSLYGDTSLTVKLDYPSSNNSISDNTAKIKGYKLTNMLKGSYDITVESDKTVKDVIHSLSNTYDIDSTNYTYSTSDDGIAYFFVSEEKYDASEEQKNSITEFSKKLYSDYIKALNSHLTFDTLSSYFEKDSELYKTNKEKYEESSYYLYTKSNPTTYANSYYSNFKFNSTKIVGIKYISDDAILVAIETKMNYRYSIYSSDSTSNMKALFKLKKSNDSYIIIDAVNMFHYF